MIAYEILVQTIADWKAGVRPTAPTPPPAMKRALPVVGQPEVFEEIDSGVVDSGEAEVDADAEAEWSEEAETEWSEETEQQ
jgi:hypothetical protein